MPLNLIWVLVWGETVQRADCLLKVNELHWHPVTQTKEIIIVYMEMHG